MIPFKEKYNQETQLIRPEQQVKWLIPYMCCSVMLLSGCMFKTDDVDYGKTGKVLTEEEILSSRYIDPETINYKEGDQIKLYYAKKGEVYYEVDRRMTDQELKDALDRYQSIVSIFGRLYNISIGQRLIEGQEGIEGAAYFDFEEANATAVDYLKTDIVYREKTCSPAKEIEPSDESALEPQMIESIQVEFGFNVQEGNGLFELEQYPAVLELLNALREVNLTEEEVTIINQKVQEVMMAAMVASETLEDQGVVENSVTIERGDFTEVFRVTPEAPHQVVFTMTLTDWFSVEDFIQVAK